MSLEENTLKTLALINYRFLNSRFRKESVGLKTTKVEIESSDLGPFDCEYQSLKSSLSYIQTTFGLIKITNSFDVEFDHIEDYRVPPPLFTMEVNNNFLGAYLKIREDYEGVSKKLEKMQSRIELVRDEHQGIYVQGYSESVYSSERGSGRAKIINFLWDHVGSISLPLLVKGSGLTKNEVIKAIKSINRGVTKKLAITENLISSDPTGGYLIDRKKFSLESL